MVQKRIFIAHSDGGQRFRPEIAHFENERNLAREREPPSGEAHQELRRRGDDHVGTRQGHAAQGGRDAERSVVAHALVRLAVGQRPEPGAKDINAADSLVVDQAAQTAAPFRRNDSGRMIGESGQHRYFVAGFCPVAGEFGGTSGGRTHLRRKIL